MGKIRKKIGTNLSFLGSMFEGAGVSFLPVALPLFMAAVSSLFEGFGMVLLIPTLKGLIDGSFAFVKRLPHFDKIEAFLPDFLFSSNVNMFIFLLAMIFLSTLIKNILVYFSGLMIESWRRDVDLKVKSRVYERFLSFGKLFYDRTNTSRLHLVLGPYIENILGFMMSFLSSIRQVVLMLIMVFIMLRISWKMTLYVMILFPIMHLMISFLARRIKKTSRYLVRSLNALRKQNFNIFGNIPLIKISHTEQRELESFSQLRQKVNSWAFSQQKKFRMIPVIEEMSFLTLQLLMISVVAYLVLRERTADFAAILVFFYVLRRAQGTLGVFNKINAMYAKMGPYLDEVKNIFSDEDKFFVEGGKRVFNGLKKGIEVRGLNFSYLSGKPVIKALNFSIKRGETLAIVGSTGSGKTTVTSLLLRLYDCPPGTIFVDGVDIRDFEMGSLLKYMAYVSQETMILDATARYNLTYGLERGVSEDEIVTAVKQARAYEFLRGLKDGLDSEIGERGTRLSGGERQRLAIARALLRDPDIIILDEATSALDSITEKMVQEAIDEAIKGRTAVVVAHRLSTIKDADRIMVMESGNRVEIGSLEELLEKKGRFYDLWEHQQFD